VRGESETYGMVRAPQQFQHVQAAASAIVAVPNVQQQQQMQPSPAKRPRVASSSMELAINELGLNQYLQPSVGHQRPSPPHPGGRHPQAEPGLIIDISGADGDDHHKAKAPPLAMVQEVLKQLLDMQKKLPLAVKEMQKAQAQLMMAAQQHQQQQQRPPHLAPVRSNGTAIVSPVRDDFEMAHGDQQLYRVRILMIFILHVSRKN
jgi:hypothetical protein